MIRSRALERLQPRALLHTPARTKNAKLSRPAPGVGSAHSPHCSPDTRVLALRVRARSCCTPKWRKHSFPPRQSFSIGGERRLPAHRPLGGVVEAEQLQGADAAEIDDGLEHAVMIAIALRPGVVSEGDAVLLQLRAQPQQLFNAASP